MTSPLAHLEPAYLWKHFDQLRQIPRPSRKEERVIEHVKKWAAERKFEVRQDAVGNICVVVPPTPGHEKAKIVIVQGHLDMVAEKDKATTFDFDKDPIEVRVDGDWVVADHTTLGADNGLGIAAAMASVDDPSVVHGPLELLFTIDEETALTGATHLDGSILKGRTLLNLDSEEDGAVFVGCAGGCTTTTKFDLVRAPAPAGYKALRVEVTGLKGGHSGLVIHENRGNSLKILARVLQQWMGKVDVLLHAIEGGNKHNAIPREASAVVLVPASFVEDGRSAAAAMQKKVLTEIATIDPGLEIKISEVAEAIAKPANAECTRRFVRMLIGLPHGVIAMSRDLAGLTETSTNLAVIQSDDAAVTITTSSRSSVEAALRFTLDQLNAVIELAGGKWSESGGYPGWQPNMASPLLKACKSVFHELRGKDPHVTAIHAGLECGIIGEKLGGADMISFGPLLEGVHAPGERVNIPSVARFWDFYKAVLRSLA
ncbi:MAG: aminoacyl-histidine dipeptidase [Deltaproteobacteria bacterium]|nr:aminoacyl-histidine dipeptidase [Deltaproteobacteria bacterium]